MPSEARHASVFHDPSGRRWLWCRVAAVLLVLGALVGGFAVRAAVFAPTTGASVGADIPWFASPRTPVLGSGPMVRAARVVRDRSGSFLVDPFTGARLRALTPRESAQVAGAHMVVDQFGYHGTDRPTISLTFDDGPDPVWTPKLLDLLARRHVAATFFLIGEEAVQYPEIVHRIAAEGHTIGIHTWSHPDPSKVTAEQYRQELVLTERVLHAETGVATKLVRLPYAGDDPGSRAAELPALLRTQQLGYAVADYDVDTRDWATTDPRRIAQPTLDGRDLTLLLHDGGGDRRAMLSYVGTVIDRAEAAGYTFETMPEASPAISRLERAVPAGAADQLAYTSASALTVWPRALVRLVFLIAVLTVGIGWLLIVGLALVRRGRRRRAERAPPAVDGPLVSVVVAAYNEQQVIGDTVRSVASSRYRNLELVVVDDGSDDRTAAVVAGLATRDRRVRLLRKRNGGKASALNRGFSAARGDVVVTVDADTLVDCDTVGAFARTFQEPGSDEVGAVAGVVKVGNRRASFLARWQALEYLTQIGLERSAQESLDAIMIVPGAGAAWRRRAVLGAGGFAEDTLAEDFDLSLTLQRRGWHVRQDDDAVCHTEAPHTFASLLRQRRRWTFGILQALWKHRAMMLNPAHRALGLVMLPWTALSILVPLVFLPFVYATAVELVLARGPLPLLLYVGVFTAVHAAACAVAVWMMRESPRHLVVAPVYRLVYEPLRAYLLYASLLAALRGRRLGWVKLARVGSVATGRS